MKKIILLFLAVVSAGMLAQAQTKKPAPTKKPKLVITKPTTTTTPTKVETPITVKKDTVKTVNNTTTTTNGGTNNTTNGGTTTTTNGGTTTTNGGTTNNGGTTTENSNSGLGGILNTIGGMLGGGGTSGGLSNGDIIAGLKQALSIGTDSSTKKLNAVDGYFANAAIKILMPAEAQKVESTLRNIGMGAQVDQAILSMNRAAEDAAIKATPIFWNAIKNITITDGLNILRGNKDAATMFLKNQTTNALTEAFRPVIQGSLDKVGATKYWNQIFSLYNQVPMVTPVNTDLVGFVTERALTGIFYSVAQEELKIRENPAARVTDLLKKVFSSK